MALTLLFPSLSALLQSTVASTTPALAADAAPPAIVRQQDASTTRWRYSEFIKEVLADNVEKVRTMFVSRA